MSPAEAAPPILLSPIDGNRFWDRVDSPIGPLLLVSDGRAVTQIHMDPFPAPPPSWGRGAAVLSEAAAQLEAYFARRRTTFDLPLAPPGTTFRRQVWQALVGVGYGTTTTYGALAAAIGSPGKARAVGAANGANPIAIVIPCHRVIGADGSLTGYAGGLARKADLLRLEAGLSYEAERTTLT